ncbi:unnamed protein product [Larinioides sclopetarius]|uniref:Uncharacterized protein n=1 Tax=Larinioides sclopetarius TaxID=280406 RepID=A0AAV2A6T4_9ARAC
MLTVGPGWLITSPTVPDSELMSTPTSLELTQLKILQMSRSIKHLLWLQLLL